MSKGVLRPALAALLLVVLTALADVSLMRGMGKYSDEGHHFRQITRFCQGDDSLDPKITMVPGYHFLSALAGRAAGDCSLGAMRLVNLAFGLLSVAAFFFAALAAGLGRPVLRTLHYYFLPILLPYHFLVYTDSISLLAVLLAAAFLVRGRAALAGVVASLGLLLRQTSVVWLVFLCLYVLVEDDSWKREPRPLRAYLRRVWPCLVGFAAFGLFLAWNGSVALGDRGAHRAGFYPGNVFFLLFLFFFLFLPRNVAILWAQRARLADARLLALLVVLFALFLPTFGAAHAYNKFPGFLRNDLLMAVDASLPLRVLFFAPVALALVSLIVDPLRRGTLALYPTALLSLLPARLIDHRYGFVPLALWLLFRRDDSPLVEGLSLALSVALAALVLVGLSRGAFAL